MKFLIFSLFLAVLLSGCSSMNIPSTPNIPLHTSKGEASVSVGINTNSFVANGSYAVTEKYAVSGNFHLSYGNIFGFNDLGDVLDPGGESLMPIFHGGYYDHWRIDAAFGRYIPFSRKSVFEIYGGGAYGHAQEGKYERNQYGEISAQANIGLKKERFEVGGFLKLSGGYMDYQYTDNYADDGNKHIRLGLPIVSIHYGGILRVGGEKWKFWVSPSLNFSHAFTKKDKKELGLGFKSGHFNTIGNLTIGVNYRF
jgi:hypothetical protein